ncbi:MAG: undecaprenyl-diphosphate phosphatase [Candidatus Rifleibacteriota bacterium]
MLNIMLQGIIQGLTEFLPVSSSGHLTLFQHFTGKTNLEANLQTDIAVHFGTLLAVIFFFRADLKPFFTISGWKDAKIRRLAMLIVSASVPTAIIGLALKDEFESIFTRPSLVCYALLFTGLLLLLSEHIKKKQIQKQIQLNELGYFKAILIGIAQSLAITPGISRSGSTISAGLLGGLKGEDSARFSFLLMIPAVGGVTLLEISKVLSRGIAADLAYTDLLIGIIISAVTGFASLKLLVFIIKRQKLSIFAYYLFTLSLISLIAINYSGK